MKKFLLLPLLCMLGMVDGVQAQHIIYINDNATGTNDGSSWANAYTDFQAGVNAAAAGDSVFVAHGTYQPASGHSFSMKVGVKIYGSFVGTENSLSQRNLSSGDTSTLSGNGSYVIYNVVNNLDTTAVLDGFKITGGNDVDNGSGAGIYNYGSSPFIIHCTFSGNKGGGLANISSASTPIITDCTFSRNSAGGSGGGIENNVSSPIITDCIFSNNSSKAGGGAIFNNDSNPVIMGCTFSRNVSTTLHGGGALSNNASLPVVTHCTFTGNMSNTSGGAIFDTYATVLVLTSCIFTGNNSTSDGGAIYTTNQCSLTISHCIFLHNRGNNGGAVFNNSPATIVSCTFTADSSNGGGGGLYNQGTALVKVVNCRFDSCVSSNGGGGIANEGATPVIINSLFTADSAKDHGAGIYSFNNAAPVIINCTFSANRSPIAAAIYTIANSNAVIANSIVYGNESGVITGQDAADNSTASITHSLVQGVAANPADHLLDDHTHPEFEDAAYGNYRLLPGSPLINKGINDSLPAGDTTDLDGNARIYNKVGGGIVDLGAYEYQGNPAPVIIPDANGILYVDSAIATPGDGSSWAKALKYLSDATKAAGTNTAIKEIHVAKGTYYPTGLQSGTNRDSTFAITRGGLKLYGGYPNGGGVRSLSPSAGSGQASAEETILSGDIGTVGDTAGNSYHVVVIAGVPTSTDSSVVEGFTITGGNADGDSAIIMKGIQILEMTGGGMAIFNVGASTAIRNCLFDENYGLEGGGIISNHASPSVSHCSFISNQGSEGGGMASLYGSPRIDHCTFTGNTASQSSAAMANEFSSPTVTNCVFSGNIGGIGASAMLNAFSHTILVNCLFKNNIAELGAAIVNQGPTSPVADSSFITRMTNCTITGNRDASLGYDTTAYIGKAVLTGGYATAFITNCLIYGNGIGPGVQDTVHGSSIVTYSLVQGMAADSANHILNSSLNPEFVDSATGNYRLQSISPLINKGSNDSLSAEDTTDLAGNLRIYDKNNGGIVDLGAYEFQGNPSGIIHPGAHGIMYVDSAAAPGGDGSSWTMALQSFAVALHAGDSINKNKPAATNSVEQIWVAKGTYRPANGQSFSMLPHVKIYGGFTGTETLLSQRDLKAGDSSNLNGNDTTVIVNNNNGLDTSAVLDGFTITGGTGGSNMPGGMYNYMASPLINHCIFTHNHGDEGGSVGAMYNRFASPRISNCIFADNSSEDQSGGIMIVRGKPVITNCLFIHNSSPDYGGALWSSLSNPLIINCTFSANTAGTGLGNAIYRSADSAHMFLRNSVVWGNMRPGQQNDKGIYNASLGGNIDINVSNSITQGYGSDTAGNKTSDPLFANAAKADYSLQAGSPAINTGNNDNLPAEDSADLAGNPRIVGGTVDIGAYEYQRSVDSTRITVQPKDSTVCAGDGVSFTVTAMGASLAYQWQLSTNEGDTWNNETGSNHPIFALSNLPATDSGNRYRVVVSGTWGRDTSDAATLHVNTPPGITTQPKDSTVNVGDDASFTVNATGTITGYQWQVSTDGTTWGDINGKTSQTLKLSNLGTSLSGNQYRGIVTGACSNDTSAPATLTVNKSVLMLLPASLAVGYTNVLYSTVTFSASGGTSPYTYTETGALPHGLSFVNGVLNGTPTQSGSFLIGVKATDNTSNDLGGPFSIIKKYSLVINTGGSCMMVSSYPKNEVACEGGAVTFSISATDATGYQWQALPPKETAWTNIQGATHAMLQLFDLGVAADGTKYRVILRSAQCGSLTTSPVMLTVHAARHTMLDDTVCQGAVYTVGDHQYSQPGTYTDTLTAYTGCDSVVVLHLTVNKHAGITTQPEDTTVDINGNVSFNVSATGTVTGYQWQSSGNGGITWDNVSNGAAETLKLSNISTHLNGFKYRVVIKGSCNNDTSRAVGLTVNIPVTWSSPDTLPTGYKEIPYSDTVKATDGTGAMPTYSEKGAVPPGETFDPVTGTLSGTPTDTGSYPITITATFPAGHTDTSHSATKSYMVIIDTGGACIHIMVPPESHTVCQGSSVTFRITVSDATGYQWQSSADGTHWKEVTNGATKTLELSNVQTSQTGVKYRVVISSACGTVTTGTAVLTVSAKTAITNEPQSQAVCEGENVGFGVEATGTNVSYQWQSLEGGTTWNNMDKETSKTLKLSHVQASQTGTKYRVVVGSTCNTVTSNAVTLTVNPLPVITITADKANPVSKGLAVRLTASGAHGYQWVNDPDIQSGWNEAMLTILPKQDITYSVTGTSAEGCTATASYLVQVVADYKLICNNIVSPNGDGKNDTWIIQNIGSYPDNKVMIFDRVGRMIYEKEHYDNQWNGMLNGGPLHEGTYYYVFIVDGGKKVFKGYIELLNGKR